jgi:GDP/UDP-N,N'-diacetylbacillosamine 2-epimerase (hydrolysing)
VISGSRSEYGLLFWLMKEIQADSDLELQVVITGMHLSPEFGLTYKEIERDFFINKKIEILLSSDTSVGISKSMGLALISFSEVYEDLKPDIIVVLGDRFEIFSAVAAALIARIPVAHIHGGELTEGAFDDAMRHSITKMSHLHFTSTEEYRKRVIQLGEQPDRVFNVGAMAIENIYRLKLLTRNEFEKAINFKLNKYNILVTFHPVTLESKSTEQQFQELLMAVDSLMDTNIIFTKANADIGGRIINKMIDDYISANSYKAIAFTSMGQLLYLSAMRYVDLILGNSSSGIIEAPSFRIATIDIGDRQKGRIKAKSVINCLPDSCSIIEAIRYANSDEFRRILKTVKNPYEKEKYPSKLIVKKIKDIDLIFQLSKKFYDIKF